VSPEPLWLTLSELQNIASSLSGAHFVKQVGPFVLLQHEAGKMLAEGAERLRTSHISRMAMVRRAWRVKSDLATLQVTMLRASTTTQPFRCAPDEKTIPHGSSERDPGVKRIHAGRARHVEDARARVERLLPAKSVEATRPVDASYPGRAVASTTAHAHLDIAPGR